MNPPSRTFEVTSASGTAIITLTDIGPEHVHNGEVTSNKGSKPIPFLGIGISGALILLQTVCDTMGATYHELK